MMFDINDQQVSVIHIKKTFELQPHLQVYMRVIVRYIETRIFEEHSIYPTSRCWPFFLFVSDYPESCPTNIEYENCTLDQNDNFFYEGTFVQIKGFQRSFILAENFKIIPILIFHFETLYNGEIYSTINKLSNKYWHLILCLTNSLTFPIPCDLDQIE